jgi:N-acetylglucosamine-6-sulfatase
MVLNIDVSPTILAHCGLPAEAAGKMDGRSFDALLRGKSDPAQAPWRDHILYEYHWEWNFPATPTTLAIRGDRYKYIYYHGIWDKNGFYDLATDPHERHNLIDVPAFQEQITQWKEQLFSELDASGGLSMPLLEPKGEPFHDRKLQR